MLRVKNMHFASPSHPWDPCGKAEPRYIKYIIRQGEAELCTLDLTSMFHHLPSVGPKQLCVLSTPRMYPKSEYFLVSNNAVIVINDNQSLYLP